ncbi:MAG: transposase [Rivularia sp. T60_A2020_040]|nr:transposase [Rivularia sp. T60_A2020_040]
MSKDDDIRQYRIDNLKQAQAARKEDSLKRVNQALNNLKKRRDKINFHSVAREANLSVSYLYKYTEIKQRIAEIRNEQSLMPHEDFKSQPSFSGVKVQARLKERMKSLEKDNKELRRKNEALAGQVYRVHQLQEQVERQQRTIEDLEMLLNECESRNPKLSSKVTTIAPKHTKESFDSSSKIDSELSSLNVRSNSTLSKLIDSNPEEVVLNAISSLKEALSNQTVRNKTGFLVKAIENNWIPNENYKEKVELDVFNEWFLLANSQRLVSASTKLDGVLHVLNSDGEWIPFEEMIAQYPLDALKSMT